MDNPNREFVFAQRVDGRDRPKGFRSGFVTICGFVYTDNDGLLFGKIHVNIQSDDTYWMDGMEVYLRNMFDFMDINGFLFFRVGGEKWKTSKYLWIYNSEYEFYSFHPMPDTHSHMYSFWKCYEKNIR